MGELGRYNALSRHNAEVRLATQPTQSLQAERQAEPERAWAAECGEALCPRFLTKSPENGNPLPSNWRAFDVPKSTSELVLLTMTVAPPEYESPPSGPSGRLPLVRWTLLTLLLLVEAGILSAAYDAANRARDGGWAGSFVAWTPAIFRWGLVAGGLAVAFAYWFLDAESWDVLRQRYPITRLALVLVGQLTAYGLFALCTRWVLGKEPALEPWELIIWLAAGGLTVFVWALAMLPPGVWPLLIWQGRSLWLRAVILAALICVVARIAREEWDVLSEPTMRSAYGLLCAILPEVVYDPETRLLGTPTFRVEVGVPCSGYEGIGLMAMYLVLYWSLFHNYLRFPRAYLLAPLGLAGVWVVNVLRIVALVWIGDRVSPALAVGGFHSQAGWIGFNAVTVGLLMLAHRSRLFTRDLVAENEGSDATLAYLTPLLAAVAVQMVATAVSPRPATLYPIRALVAGALLAYFWRRYDVLRNPGRDSSSLGLLWAVTAGAGVFLLWVALTKLEPSRLPREWSDGLKTLWIIARAIGFVVITPIAEELAFRGYLMRRLISSDWEAVPPGRFTWLSFLVSSVLFGLMHGEWWLAGILAGMAYGLVVVRTGRVRDAIIAHAVTNGLLLAVEFAL
jgi:exosortase E/protease (VPEID-CTERM system)